MQKENLIDVNEFCINHDIEISFIQSVKQTGLIEITTIKEAWYIDADQLHELEKIVRFYYEMDINLEGIETITHLLRQINSMQDEIVALKNRIRLYDVND
jgi:hypothetical protein